MGDCLALELLTIVSSLFFVAALFFSVLLSKETGGDKYWVFLVIAVLGFGIAHLADKEILFFVGTNGNTLREIGEIMGAFSLAYAAFGLYYSMKKIREQIGGELDK